MDDFASNINVIVKSKSNIIISVSQPVKAVHRSILESLDKVRGEINDALSKIIESEKSKSAGAFQEVDDEDDDDDDDDDVECKIDSLDEVVAEGVEPLLKKAKVDGQSL